MGEGVNVRKGVWLGGWVERISLVKGRDVSRRIAVLIGSFGLGLGSSVACRKDGRGRGVDQGREGHA